MFDFNQVENFDRHISLSIPSYEYLTRMIMQFSEYFLEEGKDVLDIGCSTGKHLKLMKKIKGVRYVGVDNSSLCPPITECQHILFEKLDASDLFIEENSHSLILSIFTLQFMDSTRRARTLERVKKGLCSGGAFIVAEKVFCETGKIQSIVDSAHREVKADNFTSDEIMKKEWQLRQNMKIKTESELMIELLEIGDVQQIWRAFNFVAYLVIKH